MAAPHTFELGQVQTIPGDRISFMRLPRACARLTIEPPTQVTAEFLNAVLADPDAERNRKQMQTGNTRDTKIEPVTGEDDSLQTVWLVTSSEQQSGDSEQLMQTIEVIKAIVTAQALGEDMEAAVQMAQSELFE